MVTRASEVERHVRPGRRCEWAPVEIGGNARYVSVCRRHFKEGRTHG
jgi:thymidine kinase